MESTKCKIKSDVIKDISIDNHISFLLRHKVVVFNEELMEMRILNRHSTHPIIFIGIEDKLNEISQK